MLQVAVCTQSRICVLIYRQYAINNNPKLYRGYYRYILEKEDQLYFND